MKKIKIVSVKLIHGSSDESYQKAIEDALKSMKPDAKQKHIAQIILFGMGFEEGKFRVTLQLILTELEETEDLKGKKPSQNAAQFEQGGRVVKKDINKDAKKDTSFDNDNERNKLLAEQEQSYPWHVHHQALTEFSHHTMDYDLKHSLDQSWVIPPETQLYKDIFSIVDPHIHLPESQVEIYMQPVRHISELVPTKSGFTRRITEFSTERHDQQLAQKAFSLSHNKAINPFNANPNLRKVKSDD